MTDKKTETAEEPTVEDAALQAASANAVIAVLTDVVQLLNDLGSTLAATQVQEFLDGYEQSV